MWTGPKEATYFEGGKQSITVSQHVTGNSIRSTGEQATNTFYFKLPYIGYFSSIAQKRIRRLSHFYCNNANIVLAFSSFKVGSLLV